LRVDISPYIDRVLNSALKINTKDIWDIVLWVTIDEDEMEYMDKLYELSKTLVEAKINATNAAVI